MRRREFILSLSLAANPPRTRCAAAPRQIGQAGQRLVRAAEMIDEGAEGARARYYGANATV